MLRLLTAISLGLALVFTGIGLLLARQWGWSEYASNQLYVVYAQMSGSTLNPFFLINADGSARASKLAASSGTLTTLNCSPDGRTLAFVTDTGHLTVVNQAGIVYERTLGQGYDAITTANNGTVAVTQTVYGIVRVISPNGSSLPVPPDHIAYNPIKIASSGMELWTHTAQGGIKLTSPAGDVLFMLNDKTFSPYWLSSEQMFTFLDWDDPQGANGGMADASRQIVVRSRNGIIPYGVLSPDATKQVLPLVDADQTNNQLYIADPLTHQLGLQLTHDTGVNHQPICFLTFRPQMLITGS